MTDPAAGGAPAEARPPRPVGRLRAAAEALALGLLAGFAEATYTGDFDLGTTLYLAAGLAIGFRHAGRSMACWPVLGSTLYLAHVVAIGLGARPPYVEENSRFAEICLLAVVPAGLGIAAGAGIRVLVGRSGRLPRRSGPPVRFFPRTTLDLVVAVACVAACFAAVKHVFFPPTIYAPGFDEAKFREVAEGMTPAQVVAIAGQPLRRKGIGSGSEIWQFSDQYTDESNYERRWVVFQGGKVVAVVSGLWHD